MVVANPKFYSKAYPTSMTLLVHPKKLDDLFQHEHKDQAAHLQLQQIAQLVGNGDLRSISFLRTHGLGS